MLKIYAPWTVTLQKLDALQEHIFGLLAAIPNHILQVSLLNTIKTNKRTWLDFQEKTLGPAGP